MATAQSQDSRRIVMIGKTGVGKSATGNSILGVRRFHAEARATSVTTNCSSGSNVVNGKQVLVVDTPGLYDTNMSNEKVINEVVKCITCAAPGPHVFLLVISIGRFTAEERNTVSLIRKVFGKNAQRYMMVLFTRADDLDDEQTIEDYIHGSQELTELINACRGRYHTINNKNQSDRKQINQLMIKIDVMQKQNNNSYYNYHMFTMANELKSAVRSVQEKDAIINELQRELRELQRQIDKSFCSIL